jgi:hypothetical protein
MATRTAPAASLNTLLQQLARDLEDARSAHHQLQAAQRRTVAVAERALKLAASAGAGSEALRLRLQTALQNENAAYTAISNVLKSRHDTVKNAIGNVR